MRVVRVLAGLAFVVAVAAIAWGVALLVTLDREFEPRGTVGVVLLAGGLVVLAAATLARRPPRSWRS